MLVKCLCLWYIVVVKGFNAGDYIDIDVDFSLKRNNKSDRA